MKYRDLPEYWQIGPLTFDYEKVIITFEDHSFAIFNYAFFKACPVRDEIAVFTEHCGHHIFPLRGNKVSFEEMNMN